MLSTGQNSTEAQNHQLGISEEIFVHNNSKHGRPVVAKQSPSSNAVADSEENRMHCTVKLIECILRQALALLL